MKWKLETNEIDRRTFVLLDDDESADDEYQVIATGRPDGPTAPDEELYQVIAAGWPQPYPWVGQASEECSESTQSGLLFEGTLTACLEWAKAHPNC